MDSNTVKSKQKAMVIITIALVAIVLVMVFFLSEKSYKDKSVVQEAGETGSLEKDRQKVLITKEIKDAAPLDYGKLQKDENLKDMMEARKQDAGINKSLDMIVKSDESFVVGDSKVSMQDILEKAFAKEGEVFEKRLSESGESLPDRIQQYGIYVVQPGDNIWNIHFNILKDYYAARAVQIGEKADEPGSAGQSSGVAKILKFSETMVIIYNLTDKKVTDDINLLQPLSKVVIYNMEEVFTLLGEIDHANVDRIQFDGKNIWIPAEKS